MLTDKISKFFFHHFNDLLDRQNQLVSCLRESITDEDKDGRVERQHLNWSYFIEEIIGISEKLTNNEVVEDVVENYDICQHSYKTLYNSVGNNFVEFVSSLELQNIETSNEDVRLNIQGLTKDINLWIDFFYHLNGRFLACSCTRQRNT